MDLKYFRCEFEQSWEPFWSMRIEIRIAMTRYFYPTFEISYFYEVRNKIFEDSTEIINENNMDLVVLI